MTGIVSLLRLEEIFHQAIGLPPTERGPFLDRMCPRTTLRAQIERLIEADAQADGVLDLEPAEDAAAIDAPASIGRWRLIERIGSGGLGVVYRASCECDGVTLHAAVKILRPGLNVLLHDCFIQERNILARLDHPFIARLIDAGAGACGTSFLAMEFVEGAPLDAYLEQRDLPLRDRLALFRSVCEAAAYLHEHGVIHGDLKPSNVIVRADGTPKLLDFGTARLVEGGRESIESLTRQMMTPAYASPEQLAGGGPSAAGDVYSLGCLLREMAGTHAVSVDLAVVRDKCLAAVAEHRYESARGLAADIDRYLRQRPVSAHPASASYVARKFIRRNRITCGLAALVGASLLVGSLVSRHNAVLAQQYADQHQSVVTRLLRDDADRRAPDSQQRAAYAAGVADVIAQMEQVQPPPLENLASAWRRLSYSQAMRGLTAESLASIERSIVWGRRAMESDRAGTAASQLAESLLYAVMLQQRRARPQVAGDLALEAIQLVGTLPASSREPLEHTQHFVRALFPAARRLARRGDIDRGRALLRRAIELSRTLGTIAQLRSTLDLVWFERAARQPSGADAACTAARSLAITSTRLAKLCGTDAASASGEREAAVAQASVMFERQLLLDPEHYRFRLQLARRKLQLARFAGEKNDRLRASELVREARALVHDLVTRDPDNPHLRQLAARIERATLRIGTP